MDIVEKMKNWDTWESMEKDLRPYLDDILARGKNNEDDDSIILDFYILKLLSETNVIVEFSKAMDQLRHSAAPYLKAYSDVVADIMKLHRYKDKLNHVVDAHPRLLAREKKSICYHWDILFWEKQHAIETEGGENLLMMEDSEMEEYLKAKCDELANITAKLEPNYTRQKEIRDFRMMIPSTIKWVRYQKIFRQTVPKLHKEYEERIRNIWPEDNSCSTQVKKSHASSEDNICSPKKPKLDEC